MSKQKNGIFFGFIVFCMLLSIHPVSARMLTIEEVIKEFQNNKEIKESNEDGYAIECKKNPTEKTLDIYLNKEKVISYLYTDSYIEYIEPVQTITDENSKEMMEKQFGVLGYASYFLNSIYSLSGYNYDRSPLQEDSATLDFDLLSNPEMYDNYGILFETKQVDPSINGLQEYFTHIKMSLDTDKADNLMKYLGVTKVQNTAPNVKENQTENEIVDKNGNVVENPQTGATISFGITILLGILALVLLKFSKRKSVLHKL